MYDWCELNMSTILIDHGTMGMGATNGNSTTQNVSVSGVAPTTVAFSLIQPQNRIVFEPSGRAEIKVDNKPPVTEIDLPEGSTLLPILSTLSGIRAESINAGASY